jgi:zinc transport system substrate-binding protein
MGVSRPPPGCPGGGGASGDGRTSVVAAFFPLADAARAVGGDRVRVTDLTPAGVEPHDLELTSRTIDRILDADVVVVLGGGFQPAVEKAASKRKGVTIVVRDELHLTGDDPHVWLDPTVYARIVGVVGEALHADPARVRGIEDELGQLDERYRTTLSSCRSDLLVTSHAAYGYLAARYGLRQESISGLVPEEEPDPSRLDDLLHLVEREGVTTVFTEPLLPRRAADTVRREAHVAVSTLDPLESNPGTHYVAAMDANLATLAKGLGCAA